jgi:hypothetical protein
LVLLFSAFSWLAAAHAQGNATLFLPLISAGPRANWFNVGEVVRCDPNAGVTYVNGTTRQSGQPVSGYMVAFSYDPDGPIVAQIESGPHEGYPNWPAGFYSHILGVDGPREGGWYFWIINDLGQRISVYAFLHTDGHAYPGGCQQAIVDFDYR